VLSTEADFLLDSQPSTAMSSALTSPGFVGQLEADVEPIQGLHFAAIGELLDKVSDLAPEPGVKTVPWLRGWGFINWFFAPHADVRLDAIYELDAEGPQRLGITTLLAQLHVFL